jgi:NADPH-dependent 2,4-dienoyl-CoA reductase/sulfur reductase-like enzyme/nitrite reductase/ring-hydroxylating ferredoxin subunit
MTEQSTPNGPDLTQGIPVSDLADGEMLQGHIADEAVLLARREDEYFAIGASCTHYGGPLVEGLVVGDTVRCPWHHACFSLRTGEALRAPALNPVSCWKVEQHDGRLFVRERAQAGDRRAKQATKRPNSVVIVGGGAAGSAAAETLRREGYTGRLTMLSADESVPYDRPNLSKDYLAGNASEDWIPLRPKGFYQEQGIDLRLGARVAGLDTANRHVQLEDGSRHVYESLVLATGAEPVRLDIAGADLSHVHYLRTLADSRALIAKALATRRAVVMGASFIGLEVAASLRARGIEVEVVAPDTVPMEKILGTEMGKFIGELHEQHGVKFHLGTIATSIDEHGVTLQSGETLESDLVVVGIGVRPAISLAERAGLVTDRGIAVNEYLETSMSGIFAAGDVARWPDRFTGERIRVEHWVVAQRQGQTAARNILGQRERFEAVPFFWSQHYDVVISYVGHAPRWDKIEIDGQLEARDCRMAYCREGKTLAVVTISRDRESLRAEVEIERMIAQ